MENSLSYINVLPSSKEEIKQFTANIVNELESGNYCPLETAVQFTAIEKMIKDVKANKKYKSLVRDEAENYGQIFEFKNSKIELAEVGVKYDYLVCEDDVLENLLAEQETTKALIKQRQDMLKLGINVEGEIFTKPVRTSTSSVKITLK